MTLVQAPETGTDMNSGSLKNSRNKATPRVAIIVSPNFGDYARQYLTECLASITDQVFEGSSKVFLVDNASSAESYEYLKGCCPEAQIIRSKENRGFAGGNNLAMQAAIDEGYDFLLLINMDTVMAPDCIRELLAIANQNHHAAALQARLMLWPDKDKINSTGNQTHFLGFGFCGEYGGEYGGDQHPRAIAHPSGAAVLLRCEALNVVGLFDEDFWMYCEDLDLGWRLWLGGFECWYAPKAVVYHKYAFLTGLTGSDKFYWLDRNRIISIVKNYHMATLLLVIPAFLMMELGTLLHAVSNRWLKQKLSVWRWFIVPRHWRKLLRSRKNTQSLRRKADRDIVKMFSGQIDFGPIDSLAIRGANVILSFYWSLLKKLIVW